MYDAASGNNTSWKDDVTENVAKIIEENWKTIEEYANAEDVTRRVAGMKFPKEGWSTD